MTYNTIKLINSFNKINIYNNSIVFCDIDETIMKFNKINKNWWENRLKYYSKLTNNKELSEENAYNDWLIYVQQNIPKHTDKIGLLNMLTDIENKNSKICYITARYSDIDDLTYKHFSYLDLDYINNPIYFVGNYPKGKFIKNNFDLDKYNKIIFIDDNEKNLKDVKKELGNLIDIYQFIY